MKNNLFFNFLVFLLLITFESFSYSNELKINSSEVSVDKNTQLVIFRGRVNAIDDKNNKILTDLAEYDKKKGKLETSGYTKIITSENYILEGADILFDNEKKKITSSFSAKIIDKDGNQVYVDMFEYFIDKNIFLSKGKIKVIDNKDNKYNFSEIYIDEKKNKIVGSDVRMYLDSKAFKINKKNEPRIFANSMVITDGESELNKGVCTYCELKTKDAISPWSLRAEKIKHNAANKTIYYENAVLQIYNFPIFYFPRFSHPDPTVDRRSGFLNPSMSDNSNTGVGITTPYFWAISKDRDLTISPRIYGRENPLLLAEYRQDFENASLILDTGYTEGYKKTTQTKTPGSRAHFFTKYNLDLIDEENKSSNLEVNLQKVSNDTYFKVHKIDTLLVDQSLDVIENTVNYNYFGEEAFLSANISSYQDLSKTDRSKYEYLLPYITFEKNLVTNPNYGSLDLTSNLRVRNYDVNKQTEFFVNDFNWRSNKWIDKFGFENRLLGSMKTVNYNAENTPEYKTDGSSAELAGVIGFLSDLDLKKENLKKKTTDLLTPKLLFRYAPGHMRNSTGGRLKYSNLFKLNKSNEIDILESGMSATLGLDYKKAKQNNDGSSGREILNFSMGQVISDEENESISSSTSLDQRFSDIVGSSSFNINNNLKLNYDFAIDQSYKDINYNELGTDLVFGSTTFNLSYLEEKNHIGDQEYVKSNVDFGINDSNKLSFSTKRDLQRNSAEYYNFSYNYLNDCLTAGLVFRREFYTDRDLEPENSLMFKITIVPFGNVNSPNYNK
jgi:LPS-assembly protein